MQPDVLCLNLQGLLSLFNLQDTLLLHMLYFLIRALLYGSVAAGFGFATYWSIRLIRLMYKRGKSRGSLDV